MDVYDSFISEVDEIQARIDRWQKEKDRHERFTNRRPSFGSASDVASDAQAERMSNALMRQEAEIMAAIASGITLPKTAVDDFTVGGRTMSCLELVQLAVLNARRALCQLKEQVAPKGVSGQRLVDAFVRIGEDSECVDRRAILFYRIIKDDFTTKCDEFEPISAAWLKLYRCIRTLFYISGPLLDSTHFVLEAHQTNRILTAADEDNEDVAKAMKKLTRRTKALAASILDDFGQSYKSSDLTFNQLDLAAQQLLPDGIVYFGIVPKPDSDDECGTPRFDAGYSLVEYLFDEASDDRVHVTQYRWPATARAKASESMPVVTQRYFERLIGFFADESSAPSTAGFSAVNVRNRIYQIKFTSEQLRTMIEMYRPDGLLAQNRYAYQLTQDRLMPLLYQGCDSYDFEAIVFFMDIVNSSRTQDARFTSGAYDGVRFVDRLLLKMTHKILGVGGFVDKSVYDQLLGVIKIPSNERQQANLYRQIFPLFAQMMRVLENEKAALLKRGYATVESYGFRIGATVGRVKHVVIGHPVSGIDFTVTSQDVIQGARLEHFNDKTTEKLKEDEKQVLSVRVDKNLLYRIFKATCPSPRRDPQDELISMWTHEYFAGLLDGRKIVSEPRCENLPGLGKVEFGVFTVLNTASAELASADQKP